MSAKELPLTPAHTKLYNITKIEYVNEGITHNSSPKIPSQYN